MPRLHSLAVCAISAALVLAPALQAQSPPCATAGLTLPPGFCATVFADSLPGPRHLTVAEDGTVYVALRGRRGAQGAANQPGGVVALRDGDRDGAADRRETLASGFAATEVVLQQGTLLTETGTAIVRYRLAPGGLGIVGGVDTVVAGLPGGGHSAKTFTVDARGRLMVNLGSLSNACQERDRQPGSMGRQPCTELETRAGIWRFDAQAAGQTLASGERWATGIRNAVAITTHPRTGALWVMQHGRDNLSSNWPERFTTQRNAETPSEELFRVERGDDFGWPYCYHDGALGRKVQAPEYGGDGTSAGSCARTKGNVASFPAHWAPNALLFHSGKGMPAKYGRGAFIAFHGSWNRAPEPQAGANVVFLPMNGERAAGTHEIFADGFASTMQPSIRGHRPTGLAEGPDGALYVTDDQQGRIWRITYSAPRR